MTVLKNRTLYMMDESTNLYSFDLDDLTITTYQTPSFAAPFQQYCLFGDTIGDYLYLTGSQTSQNMWRYNILYKY